MRRGSSLNLSVAIIAVFVAVLTLTVIAAHQNQNTIPSSATGTVPSSITTFPCDGDGQSGYRFQTIYYRAKDIPDHYTSDWIASYRHWLQGANNIFIASAAQTSGYRSLRFVHNSACEPTIDNIVVNETEDDSPTIIVQTLKNKGYSRFDRKYIVFVDKDNSMRAAESDGPMDNDSPAQSNPNNSGPNFSLFYKPSWNDSDGPNTIAHEVAHILGAVQSTAPNYYQLGMPGHCADDYDLLCDNPDLNPDCPDPANENRLDCNHNDYFHTNPQPGNYLYDHWNIANSQFLLKTAPPTPTPTPPTNNGTLQVYVKDATTNSKFNQYVTIRSLYMSDCPQGCPGPSNNACTNPVCTPERNKKYSPSDCNGQGCATWPNYNSSVGYYLSVCTSCTDPGTLNLPSTYEISSFGCGSTTKLYYPPSGGASCTITVRKIAQANTTTIRGYIFHDDESQPTYPNARKNDESIEPSIPGVTLTIKGYKSTVSTEDIGNHNYIFKKTPSGSFKFLPPTIPPGYSLLPCGKVNRPNSIPSGNNYFYCADGTRMILKKWDPTNKRKGFSPPDATTSYGSFKVISNQTTTVDFPLVNSSPDAPQLTEN